MITCLGIMLHVLFYLLYPVFTVVVPILLFFFRNRSFDGNIWVCQNKFDHLNDFVFIIVNINT